MTDWTAIEVEYTTSTASVRAIAARHGITDGAIRQKAKRHGWQRATQATTQDDVRTYAPEVRSPPVETPEATSQDNREEESSASPNQGKKTQVRYSRALADDILARLAEGEPLRSICSEAKYPAASTVVEWATNDVDGFSERYAHARGHGIDAMADEVVTISDESGADIALDERTGELVVQDDVVARSRLRTDNRNWMLSQMAIAS